ncbi:MAG: MoaD/ThiS family protein [Actinomycetota bacterium]
MSVEVRVPTVLRKHTGGEKAVDGSGSTVGAVVDSIDASHPGLKEAIVTPDGTIHRFINIYLNDEDIRFIGALETPVSDGDVISILPAVAGG